MKKLLLLVFIILLQFQSNASHVAGGELTYKFIGDSASPNLYEVTLTLYRLYSSSSATLSSSASVKVTSSCYSQQTTSLNRFIPSGAYQANDGGYIFISPLNCVSVNSPQYLPLSVHKYKGTVTLGGPCNDFVFTYELCCRNAQINNLVNAASQDFYLMALLNNTRSNNNSPSFNHIPITNVCLSKPSYNHFGCMDSDGDSLYYEMEAAKTTNNVAINYAAGYSSQSPITTQNGIRFDSLNGLMSFVPTQVETDVVRVKVREFRYFPADTNWILMGSITRDIEVAVNSSCLPSTSDTTFFQINPINVDTASTINCGDSVILLKLQKPVLVDSITTNATEFGITDGRGLPIPILSAKSKTTILDGLFTDEILLAASAPFTYNDTLTLQLKKGSDGNTLVGACGGNAPEGMITLIVSSCSTFFNLLENAVQPAFSAYPNPVKNVLFISPAKGFDNTTYELILTDITGRVMLRETKSGGAKDWELDCAKLESGIYTVSIRTEASVEQTIRFIKE